MFFEMKTPFLVYAHCQVVELSFVFLPLGGFENLFFFSPTLPRVYDLVLWDLKLVPALPICVWLALKHNLAE